jgi:hypothetical protein
LRTPKKGDSFYENYGNSFEWDRAENDWDVYPDPQFHLRWCKPKATHSWREYAITRDDQGYCVWTDAGDRWPLHVIESSPTPLGLFGGVQFEGCDTWSILVAAYENDGGLHLFSHDHDSKLAVPVKCRFWEEK